MDSAEPDVAPPGLLIEPKVPALNTEVSAAQFAKQVEDSLVALLRRKHNNTEHLSKVGIFLRSNGLLPEGKLKLFLEGQCRRVEVVGDPAAPQYVTLAAQRASQARGPSAGQGGSAPAGPVTHAGHSPEGPAGSPSESAPRPAPTHTDAAALPGSDMNEEALERALVQQLRSQPDRCMAGPTLGDFCIKELGFSMKGRLGGFLRARPHLFRAPPNDPHQLVYLVESAAGRAGAARPPNGSMAPPPATRVHQGWSAPTAGISRPAAPAPDVSDVAEAHLRGAAAAARETRTYSKWDVLTQEVFNYVRSKGVATFQQVDAHMRAHCRAQISATGINPTIWSSKVFLGKRRNIFRLKGPVVSLAAHVPGVAPPPAHAAGTAGAGGGGGDPAPPPATSPPPKVAAKTAVPNPPPNRLLLLCRLSGTPPSPTVPPPPRASESSTGAPLAAAAAHPGGNPPLTAFIEQRTAMEELRDDVQHKLASFKALSELQKVNAGLRAACVTLGRELLSMKQELTALKDDVLGALSAAGISAAAGAVQHTQQAVSMPMVNGGAGAYAVPVQHTPSGSAADVAGAMPAVPAGGSAEGGILLVGGHDGVSWLDSVDCFQPRAARWSSLPLLDQPRSFAAVVTTPSDIFVAGGGNSVDWYSTVVRYDRLQGAGGGGWQQLSPMSVARGSLAAVLSCGRVYVVGGGKPKEQYNVVEWYDAAQDRWFIGPPLNSRRFALGGASLDDAVYAVGGYDGDAYLTSLERLDPREGRWTVLPGEMASKRDGHPCVASGGLLYAVGGFDSQQAIPHCEVYDPRAASWRPLADMSDSRAYGSAAAVAGQVYAVGGLQADMQTHTLLVERYDPPSDTWVHVELPANANPRRSFLAACGLE